MIQARNYSNLAYFYLAFLLFFFFYDSINVIEKIYILGVYQQAKYEENNRNCRAIGEFTHGKEVRLASKGCLISFDLLDDLSATSDR